MSRKSDSFRYSDIVEARRAYREGRNVTEWLRTRKGIGFNSSEIIEIAYDLQAGTYIQATLKDLAFSRRYAGEMAEKIGAHLTDEQTLLDVGTGEMTTLSLVVERLAARSLRILAFDLSWSRIHKGIGFAKKYMGSKFASLEPFVADMAEIPIVDKAVDVTISSHALEPNGGRLSELLAELFRITREKLLLFEPCYELASSEGRARMESLGYIRGMESTVTALGGAVLDRIPLRNVSNPLNPTACFVLKPPAHPSIKPFSRHAGGNFSVPGSNYPLRRNGDLFYSDETGLCFPVVRTIPVLKSSVAIVASAYTDAGECDEP